MKERLLFVCFVFILIGGMAGAAITSDQWNADFSLYQKYMSSVPKNYAAAVNLTRKWVDYARTDAAQVESAAGEGVTEESLTAVLNNIYREAADVICNDYSSLMTTDPIKAAEFAISIQAYFRANPEIFAEFAAANNSSVAAMNQVMDQAIKDGILKTYQAAANEYSSLSAAGKHDEAAKVSAGWLEVVSAWNATNSPIPEAFKSFAGVDTDKTVSDVKDFEKDYAEWRQAVANGDEKRAFELVKKWVDFEAANPERASAMQYIYSSTTGVAADAATDWKNAFNVATYARFWTLDVKAYETAIAEGRLADAIALIKKWETIFAGEFGEAICSALSFGFDSATAISNLATERTRLENVDPGAVTENVESFKKDLAEHGECGATGSQAEPGSDEWYNALARAVELADKWSRIAAENPALAAEISKATGINLPKDADENIKQLLQVAAHNSGKKFNEALGSGNLQGALDLVKVWDDYLKNHQQAGKIAEEIWPGISSSLTRFQTGLNIIIGNDDQAADTSTDPAATDATQQTAPGTLGVTGQ